MNLRTIAQRALVRLAQEIVSEADSFITHGMPHPAKADGYRIEARFGLRGTLNFLLDRMWTEIVYARARRNLAALHGSDWVDARHWRASYQSDLNRSHLFPA